MNLELPDLKWCNSVERAAAVAEWATKVPLELSAAAGPHFWQVVSEQWSGFDLVDHDQYRRLLARYRPWWSRSSLVLALPDCFRVWRGGPNPNGLSWTESKEIAEGFARGHRAIRHKSPLLVTAEVDRSEVALVLDDRKEVEVVLFDRPAQLSLVSLSRST